MKKASNPLAFLTVLTLLFAFAASPVSAKPSNVPQYVVLLSRGTLGGSATGQWAATQSSAGGIVGFYINVQEVPGLTISWSAPGGTVLQALDWNTNPKERLARAALRYTTPGVYTATCTLTYTCPSSPGTVNIPFLVIVL